MVRGNVIQGALGGAPMRMLALLLAALIPFGVTLVAVKLLLRFAASHLLDMPNARSSHSIPTPRGGGVGVLIGMLAGAFAVSIVDHRHLSVEGAMVLTAVAAVAAISFLDDLRPLPSWLRLLVHLGAAVLAVRAIGSYDVITVPLAGSWAVGTTGVVLSIVWCVGLTNAYNFMDGIDGIAGIQGVAAGLTWGVIGACSGDFVVAAGGLVMVSAVLAFLRSNWHPARLFLGDVGSATLGFVFAVLPLLASRQAADPGLIPAAGLLAVWPFVFDAIYTFARRLRRGEDVLAAHRGHFYQRLVVAGWSHAGVATLYGALALLGGAAAVALVIGGPGAPFIGWAALLGIGAMLLLLVARAERAGRDRVSSGVTSASGDRTSAS
jgi:UDP-N-acetylmuramyl pentapeptide phosphotransferase/UDP-N-acetylglucosamine-1-phosphate transferase